jgi:hypothetical protein
VISVANATALKTREKEHANLAVSYVVFILVATVARCSVVVLAHRSVAVPGGLVGGLIGSSARPAPEERHRPLVDVVDDHGGTSKGLVGGHQIQVRFQMGHFPFRTSL